jgi:hypothetical protein
VWHSCQLSQKLGFRNQEAHAEEHQSQGAEEQKTRLAIALLGLISCASFRQMVQWCIMIIMDCVRPRPLRAWLEKTIFIDYSDSPSHRDKPELPQCYELVGTVVVVVSCSSFF